MNFMYPGNNIANPSAKNWKECAVHCYKNARCKAFTYTIKKKRCSLKAKIVRRKAKSGKISGTRQCAVANKGHHGEYISMIQ